MWWRKAFLLSLVTKFCLMQIILKPIKERKYNILFSEAEY